MNTESVLPILFELFAKSLLITFMATVLARVWRGATAAQRHLVWLVALATVMLLPVTRLITPRWAIPLHPATKVSVRLPELPPPPVTNADATSLVEVPAAPPAVSPLPDWRKILLGVWLFGAGLLLGYRLFGSWRLRRLRHRSILVDDPRVRLLLSRILSEFGLHRRPEIRLSEECRVPVTWGSLRPMMLLPKTALEWSDTWLAAALRHEAAHIRRYDYFTRWLAHLACALYWPNLLVWLLARALRLAQEQAADDLVLRAGTPADEYATQLVDAARAVVTHGLFVRQAVAMACPSTLEDRVRAIIDGRRDRRPLSRLAVACGSLTIALALGISTTAQLRSDEQKPPPAPAAGASTSPVKSGPQIEIESKFIEITTAPGKAAPPVPEKPAIYSDPQFQLIIRALNQKKGVDLLSAPRVTTAANQRVTVETIREFRYPTAWEKDGKKWKSTKADTKNCGITLDVTPRITDDGAVELHAVATSVEFLGFVDLDNGGTTPAKKKNGPAIVGGFPPVPAGHRSKPVFSEPKSETTVTLESGQTVEIFVRETADVQHVVDGKSARDDIYRRQTFLYISPRIINPAPAKEALKEGSAATTVLTANKSAAFKEWKVPPDLIPAKPGADGSDRVSAKDWLISQGVTFEGASTAIYILATSRLIVRNTPQQIELVDQIVSAGTRDQGPAPAKETSKSDAKIGQQRPSAKTAENASRSTSAAADSPAERKAEKIILPDFELRSASIEQALDVLRKLAIENDPEKAGVKLLLQPGALSQAEITVSLHTIPLIEAVTYVAGLANLELAITPNALTIQPPGGSTSLQAKPAAPAAMTDRVSITLSAKKSFKGSDGIEIREVTGSASTFHVGGTYRVRGVCHQDTFRNASLYLGITAEGSEGAIKPASGTSLSKTAPKGRTEFEFAFTPLRPGKLHITLYDLDNYDPKDNAGAGLYLGDVSP